ncbi:MAG: 3-oxoacyl-[acyl-carrier-protein] reductase [Candidatus Cloacimonadota bacterium]|nr:MAG: 3-oxoacyl-[acyl-carrier-protein] reductase [Candidatus Cloacimonadota bacterium]
MKTLKNKVAIVTGASRGIGLAIAENLAQYGVKLALISTNLDTITKVAKDISEKYGVETLALQIDVKSADEINAGVKKVLDSFSQIDIMVNNAGITRDNLIIRMKEDDWSQVIDTNLKGAFSFCKAVTRPMMKKRTGVIINISSVVGIMGNAGQSNYAAAKAGMIGLTKSLAKELGARNIRVNAIAPGFIVSKMTEEIPEKSKDEMLSRIPLGNFGEAKNIADCVSFLSSSMGNYITGSVIQVDGGLNM